MRGTDADKGVYPWYLHREGVCECRRASSEVVELGLCRRSLLRRQTLLSPPALPRVCPTEGGLGRLRGHVLSLICGALRRAHPVNMRRCQSRCWPRRNPLRRGLGSTAKTPALSPDVAEAVDCLQLHTSFVPSCRLPGSLGFPGLPADMPKLALGRDSRHCVHSNR